MTVTIPTQTTEPPLEPTAVDAPVREPATDSSSPEPEAGHEHPTPKPRRPRRRRAVRGLISPPDLWDQPRPSLQQLWSYARYGEWTGRGTVGRGLGIAYCIAVSFAAHLVGYIALWIVERPARAGFALALLVVFSLTAPGHVARQFAADVLTLLADLIRPEGG